MGSLHSTLPYLRDIPLDKPELDQTYVRKLAAGR
jgi:predicted signal transduction protein with EAL and GGDEF domain